MRAILIIGVIIMPWLDDMKAVSAAIAQPANETDRRRSYQQQIPGGATQQEWDQLERQADQWGGTQPDRMMSIVELNAKRATGQITEEQYRESMDILTGNVPPPPPRPRRR
jgi:hypothetical protein